MGTRKKKIEQVILPDTGFMRLAAILQFIPVCRATWYLWIKEGKVPAAIKLGEKTAVWRAEDIRALIEKLGGADVATKESGDRQR